MGAVKVTLVRAKRPSADPRNQPKTADEVKLIPAWFNSRHFINVLEADEFSPPLAKSYLIMAGGLQFPTADPAAELAGRLHDSDVRGEDLAVCPQCGELREIGHFEEGFAISICKTCGERNLAANLAKGAVQ